MKCHPGSRSEEQEDAGKRLLIEREVLGNEKRFFEFSDTWHLTKRLSIKRSIVNDGRIAGSRCYGNFHSGRV